MKNIIDKSLESVYTCDFIRLKEKDESFSKCLKNKKSILNLKTTEGITLIALVITIVILFILAGISIMGVTKKGIFSKAKLAKEEYTVAEEKEDKTLNVYDSKIDEYSGVSGTRDTITIPKEEYDKLKNIGQTYTKTNTINISRRATWTSVPDATWTIPAGTWVIDFYFRDINTGTGIWTFYLGNLDISDAIWKSSGDYNYTHFTYVKTYEQETTGNFNYYQAISGSSRNIDFTMTAVRIK